jgi:hypothetical protein
VSHTSASTAISLRRSRSRMGPGAYLQALVTDSLTTSCVRSIV